MIVGRSFSRLYHKSVPQGTQCTRFRISRQQQIRQLATPIVQQCANEDDKNSESKEDEGGFYLPTDFLKSALSKAVDNENYDLAAKLNKEISLREKDDPVKQLKLKLQQAIEDECFTDAVILRNQLNLRMSRNESSSVLRCSSNVVTNGIRVMVDSAYSKEFSKPIQNQFVFMYRVRIINQSEQTVQVTNRRFLFTDSVGFNMQMEGQGIGGDQPIIHPGQEFKFSGMYPLQTPEGFLQGEFVCEMGDQNIPAKIGKLQLDSQVFHWPEDIVFIPYDN